MPIVNPKAGERFYKTAFFYLTPTYVHRIMSKELPDGTIQYEIKHGEVDPDTGDLRAAFQPGYGSGPKELFEHLVWTFAGLLLDSGLPLHGLEIHDYSIYPTWLDQIEALCEAGTFAVVGGSFKSPRRRRERL
jgi:hypothetical protein